jgi:outer membrane receptor protein involved in Fe transport
VEIPIGAEGRKSKLTVGGGYHLNNRQNEQVLYTLQGVEVGTALDIHPTEVITDDRFFIFDSIPRFDLWYTAGGTELDSDIGSREIYSGFAKLDYQILTRLRAVGGLRVEYTDIYQDILLYDQLGLPPDHPDRRIQGGVRVNPSSIEEWDFMPSINLIYKLKDDRDAPMNLRLSYFRSIGRPSFREISSMSLLDFELRDRVTGNPNLVITKVNNYDVRWEMYRESGNLFSVTVFYKDFQDHIELARVPGAFTWQNIPESYALGLELEAKVQLTKKLEFRGNLSLIESETSVTEPVEDTRPMFGQAPYIVNAMLTYNFESIGLTASGSYNVQGPRLAVVPGAGSQAPNVFLMPRNVVDLNFSKRLGDHFIAGFKIRDLINNPVRRAYDFDAGYLLNFDSFRWGTTFQLNVTYTI